MTVYVDDMRLLWRGMRMSHLLADSEAELHAVAQRIGMKPEWYQGDHYDVSERRRVLAIKLGAVQISYLQASAMALLKRNGQPMGEPETARERYKAHRQAKLRAAGLGTLKGVLR